MPHFTITEVGPADLTLTWPLVRAVVPGADLPRWQEFAASLLSRGGGVMGVAVEESGYLGVATYEPVATLCAGKVLRVDALVAFELTRRSPVRAALFAALDRLAPLLGCDAVAVTIPSRSFLAQAKGRANTIAEVNRRFDRITIPRKPQNAGHPPGADG